MLGSGVGERIRPELFCCVRSERSKIPEIKSTGAGGVVLCFSQRIYTFLTGVFFLLFSLLSSFCFSIRYSVMCYSVLCTKQSWGKQWHNIYMGYWFLPDVFTGVFMLREGEKESIVLGEVEENTWKDWMQCFWVGERGMKVCKHGCGLSTGWRRKEEIAFLFFLPFSVTEKVRGENISNNLFF